MFQFLRTIAHRWASWVGDRDLEIALRKRLESEQFYGDSAAFENFRLVAIQRPAWLQVFGFSAKAKSKSSNEFVQLYGLVRQDERSNRTPRPRRGRCR